MDLGGAGAGAAAKTAAAVRATTAELVRVAAAGPRDAADAFARGGAACAAVCRGCAAAFALLAGAGARSARAVCTQMDDAVCGTYALTDAASAELLTALEKERMDKVGAESRPLFAKRALSALLGALGVGGARAAFIVHTVEAAAEADTSSSSSKTTTTVKQAKGEKGEEGEEEAKALEDATLEALREYRSKWLAPVRAVGVVQRAVRAALCRRALAARVGGGAFDARRCAAFRVLCRGEAAFVALLNETVRLFYVPLAAHDGAAARTAARADVAAVFGALPKLLIGHSQLLRRLRRVRDTWPRLAGLPRLALESARVVDLHVGYARDSAYAQQRLAQLLRANHAFRDFVRRVEARDLRGEFELAALLTAPLNRVLSYEACYAAFVDAPAAASVAPREEDDHDNERNKDKDNKDSSPCATSTTTQTKDEPDEMRRAYAFLQAATRRLQQAVVDAPARARVLTAVARLGGFSPRLPDVPERTLIAEYPASVTVAVSHSSESGGDERSAKRTRSSGQQHITLFSDVLCVSHERKRRSDAENEGGDATAELELDDVYALERAKFVLEEICGKPDMRQQCSFSLLAVRNCVTNDDSNSSSSSDSKKSEKSENNESNSEETASSPTETTKPVTTPAELITIRLNTVAARGECVGHIQALHVQTVPRAQCEAAAAAGAGAVFGVPLARLAAAGACTESGVPLVVERSVARLSTPAALACEGVFRLSGSAARVAALRRRIEGAKTPDAWALTADDDTLAVAGVLKAFLRELEDPLLTAALLPRYEAAVAGAGNAPADAVTAVLPVLAQLPRPNLRTFLRLNGFLALVAAHSAENMMDAKNLSIVFAPNIFFGSGAFRDVPTLFSLCTALIVHNDVVQKYFVDSST